MSALATIKNALAACGTSPVDVVFFGDSITEGSVAGTHEKAWPALTRDRLRSVSFCGSVKGGIGYIPALYATASLKDAWSKSGTTSDGTLMTGLGQRMVKVNNGGVATFTFTGTGIDLIYTTGINSAFSYLIDGQSKYIDARVSGVNSGNVISIRGLCEKEHTIAVKGTNVGNAYLEGAMIYRGDEDMGIRVWESGHSGFRASDHNATDRWHGSFGAIPSPKLIVVTLGINEYNTGVDSVTYGAELATLTDTLRGLSPKASIVVVSQHQRVVIGGRESWSAYEAQAASVATAGGYGYLAMSPVFGNTATAISAGLLESGTGLHPTATGHAKYAGALVSYVTG